MLDSNICIYMLQGNSSAARDRIQSCVPGELVTSAIAYAEVMRGIPPLDSGQQSKAEAFFRLVIVLPFDQQAALLYRRVPFKRGTFDRLIAAHALSRGLTFVTNNEADFADVAELKVENWTKP